MGRNDSWYEPPDGYLLVTCWCEEHTLLVPIDEVKAGLTHHCKLRPCRNIARSKGQPVS